MGTLTLKGAKSKRLEALQAAKAEQENRDKMSRETLAPADLYIMQSVGVRLFVPLEVGTHIQLLRNRPRTLSKRDVKRALERHCASRRYLVSLITHAHRYKLDGSKSEQTVPRAHALRAKKLVNKLDNGGKYDPNNHRSARSNAAKRPAPRVRSLTNDRAHTLPAGRNSEVKNRRVQQRN